MPGHTVSRSTYYVVSVALAILLVITLAAAEFDLGVLNIFIALAIATTKAVLIVLYFMHLRYSPPLVKLTAVGAFVWLGILLAFLLADYYARGWLS